MNSKTIYNGGSEQEESVKILKAIFSTVALVIFLLALLGDDHDVRGFYSSLLIQSSTQIMNLLETHKKIKKDVNIEIKSKKRIKVALFFASGSFILAVALLCVGHTISVVNSYLSGDLWWITFLFFPFIIYAFIIDICQPINTIFDDIRTEPRQ